MTVQKLVLMVQPVRLQGLIWQAVLKSQQISVIWETPETNLAENLDQLKAAGLVLPDLLLVDMQNANLNPYAFCRWCREQYPQTKVVLTNSGQSEISLSERQWAVNQGASDLLPGFRQESLVSGVAIAVKRILEILDGHPFNNGALISVLLTIKRQLEEKAGGLARSPKAVTVPQPDQNGHLMISTLRAPVLESEALVAARTASSHGNGNGNGNGTKNGTTGKPGSSLSGLKATNGQATVSRAVVVPTANDLSLSEAETEIEVAPRPQPPTAANPDKPPRPNGSGATAAPTPTSQPQRRYRGLYY